MGRVDFHLHVCTKFKEYDSLHMLVSNSKASTGLSERVCLCVRIRRTLLEDAQVKPFILRLLLLLLLLLPFSTTLFHSLFALYIQQTISTESKICKSLSLTEPLELRIKPIKTNTDTGSNVKNGMKVKFTFGSFIACKFVK